MICGVSVKALAEKCGTPLMIYDEKMIEDHFADYMTAFVSDEFDTDIVYASKAFSCPAMIGKVRQAGACLDVVSGGEMHIALAAGMPPEKIFFHGNNKTYEELKTAVEAGCGTIVMDNLAECGTLAEIAAGSKCRVSAMLRINPGVSAHTHDYIMTATSDSKFGIGTDRKDEIAEVVRMADSSEYIHFRGFHSHIGSQIFESSSFEKAAEILIDFCRDMKESYDIDAPWLSLGGGFGIKYTDEDHPVPIKEMCSELIKKCEESIKKTGAGISRIMIEPGRSIAGDAGCTVYRTGYEKTAGERKYIFVDGGMGDNIRPALYEAEYACDLVGRENEPKDTEYTVAGKYCESGDILIKNVMLPEVKDGDLLMIYSTGAYGYSMSSCYNGIGRLPVIFVKDGKARLVLRRETDEDILNLVTEEEVNI